MPNRTRAAGDQDTLSCHATIRQHRMRRRQRGNSEASADHIRHVVREWHGLLLGQNDKCRRRSVRATPCGVPQPHALTDAGWIHSSPGSVDNAHAVAVRNDLRKWHGRAA